MKCDLLVKCFSSKSKSSRVFKSWWKHVLINFIAQDYKDLPFLCFQYILRKKRLIYWEISDWSIGLNFTSLTDFWPWKWGVDLYMSSTYVPVNSKTAHPRPGRRPGIWLTLSSVLWGIWPKPRPTRWGIWLSCQNVCQRSETKRIWYSTWAAFTDHGCFPLCQGFRKFRLEFKWKSPFRFLPTGIFGITSGGGPLISVGIFRLKFVVPFLTNRFFALIREFERETNSGKSHSYWLDRFFCFVLFFLLLFYIESNISLTKLRVSQFTRYYTITVRILQCTLLIYILCYIH